MPRNDQANDRYNPPSNLSQDFEEVLFSELEDTDLFWLKKGGDDNPHDSKLNDSAAGTSRTRLLVSSLDRSLLASQRR